jgi:hypothetical protein
MCVMFPKPGSQFTCHWGKRLNTTLILACRVVYILSQIKRLFYIIDLNFANTKVIKCVYYKITVTMYDDFIIWRFFSDTDL